MATALQQQLAVINARSTDQLNLKAQKARHSQSLLFEPREAGSQSFDTLFQICQEGFAELCQLDRRYAPFVRNLFAEDSVNTEREHMTATENKELDATIEQFLSLVSGKLLLRPAQKSVEWLVRRWRIHENNTSLMLYAFVPYHGHDIFATVLSILPKRLPPDFTFLRPYMASLQCPPRHALVAAAVSNSAFITSFSSFVLSASKRRLQSSLLVGSWVSILAQSLNARLDAAQSGRDEVRRQKSEDVLLGILPTLQEMLAIADAPDLFLAACMIMTILSTKVELEDKVLDAMMESIVRSWTNETVRDGIECLTVLAEEKDTTSIPRTVFEAIVKSDAAASAIISSMSRLRADNLILGLLDFSTGLLPNDMQLQSTELLTQILQHAYDQDLLFDALRQTLSEQSRSQNAPAQLKVTLDKILNTNDNNEIEDVKMIDDGVEDSASSSDEDDKMLAIDEPVPQAKPRSGVPESKMQSFTISSINDLDAFETLVNDFGTPAYDRLAEVFRACKVDLQNSIVARLFSQAAPEELNNNAIALRALHSIKLPSAALVHLLSLTTAKAVTESNRSAKRQRISKTAPDRSSIDVKDLNFALKRASLCLELVEDTLANRRRRIDDKYHTPLIKQLFALLGEVQTWRAATGSDLTYLQVLTLENMLAVLKFSDATSIDQSCLRTDMIVETLRSTASPQVHNSALLVISKIATFAPDAVLHSVMPLFTFMSSSTLRQADAYSVHVINMTIESIVPPLRESLKKRGKDLVAGASDLLLSFTAAFEHIPGHRRNDTFVQLLKVLGPNEALYAVMAMLVERYSEDNTLVETLRSIASSFGIHIQMRALAQYLDLTYDACKKRRSLSETILGFTEKNAAEANSSVATLLSGWASLVANPSLRSKLKAELRKEKAQEMLDTYGKLLEKLVSLPLHEGIVIKFTEPTLKNAHASALQALLALLPTEEFITSSAGLMQAGSEQVRVQVFDSLTQRVKDAKTNDTQLVSIFLETLPNCAVFLSTTQPVSVRKAAITCADAISEKFGKREPDAVSSIIKTILGPAALSSDSAVLQTASILWLASSVDIVRMDFVSVSGHVLEVTLELSTTTLRTSAPDWQLIDASFALFNAILDHQPWMLDAVVLQRALTLACQVQEVDDTKSWSAKQFCTLVPKQVALKELCTVLNETFTSITDIGSTAMVVRAKALQLAVDVNTKSTITKNADALSDLILRSFTLLAILDEDDEAYAIGIQSALDMTLKMNDLTFRPIYMRLVSWAETGDPDYDPHAEKELRLMSVYEFSQRLFDQLGSIVTTYASFILDNAIATLTGNRKTAYWSTLAIRIMHALQASFKQDQDDFWSAPQHFDGVAKALLGLLTQPIVYREEVVNETIVELAAAVSGSSEHLKVMNTHIMTALRDQEAAVRLWAVRCERDITERLTFDWLALLPEMLPFISELLEDSDEAVEREVLGWVAQIEQITGESLEGMLA
ncbi:hypothetical protein AMS68_001341 [Peltaster fructicola]|uniref:U3 small nucleolar RNA-associated protein 10 n=1 Tax=Peltaster fructicola TaxID=286661 RepID=A0A6H0XM70_9PEZI|nr:hypothetical protein AMS68_001341 [Peltaster fructicola]